LISQHVHQMMRRHFQSVLEKERPEAVTKLISDHRLLAVPVLDKFRAMQGIVTIDDAMQAARQNADQQLQKVGGMEALDGKYALAHKRQRW
jgi:magnesium transporter